MSVEFETTVKGGFPVNVRATIDIVDYGVNRSPVWREAAIDMIMWPSGKEVSKAVYDTLYTGDWARLEREALEAET